MVDTYIDRSLSVSVSLSLSLSLSVCLCKWKNDGSELDTERRGLGRGQPSLMAKAFFNRATENTNNDNKTTTIASQTFEVYHAHADDER